MTGLAGGIILGTTTAIFLPNLILSVCNFVSFEMRDLCENKDNFLQYDGVFSTDDVVIRRACVGVLLSISGEIGDLIESAVKRRAGMKDSGKLLPGQGGALDRMDSCLLSAIIYFWYMM